MVDHKSYPAYKDLRGTYSLGSFALGIDHAQGDPFPSRLSVQIDGAKAARRFSSSTRIPALPIS